MIYSWSAIDDCKERMIILKKWHLNKRKLGTFAITTAALCTIATGTALANTVTVQPGDSMWSIASYLHMPLQTLESDNPSVNPNSIAPGMLLQVPGTETSSYSSNLYWLEHIINAEAGGQSLEAQVAVGDVILNRLAAGGYGNTIEAVVCQVTNGYYQFTSVQNGYVYATPNASSIRAAQLVLAGNDNEVPGALVFYNPAQTPSDSWVWSQPRIAEFGQLVFAT